MRVIGHDCGHRHFGADFAAAQRIFEREQQEGADLDYLADRLPLVQQMLAIVEAMLGTADALDRLKQRTHKGLSSRVAKEIYRHIDTYRGFAIVENRQVITSDGPEFVQRVVSNVACDGWRMLAKGGELAWPLLERARRDLEPLNIRTQDGVIDAAIEWGAVGMAKVRTTLTLAAARILQAHRICRDIQIFHSEQNLERMLAWSYQYRGGSVVNLKRDTIGFVFHHKPHTVRVPPRAPELKALLPKIDVLERFDPALSKER